MMKSIFIKHSKRLSVLQMSQESYRKTRNDGRELAINDRELAMATVTTLHSCIRPGQKKKKKNS